MKIPARSPKDQVKGMAYFARMLDKIRLHSRGELRDDLIGNLGKGADGWCCDFLHVHYEDLKEKVLSGLSDEQALAWCFANGHALTDTDIMIWNSFISKLGWNDRATSRLEQLKKESNLEHRTDIITMGQFIDADEGRG